MVRPFIAATGRGNGAILQIPPEAEERPTLSETISGRERSAGPVPAERLALDLRPRTVLLIGGAAAMAGALRAHRVEATWAEDFERARAAGLLEQEYDLVVCPAVAERLSEEQRRQVVESISACARDVILGPERDTGAAFGLTGAMSYWSRLFAERGFFLDIDYDASFLTPFARRFRRLDAVTRDAAPLDEAATVRREVAAVRRSAEEKDRAILTLRYRLFEIQQSVAWKAASRISAIMERVLRAHSRRLNIYWKLRRTLEVLLDEGPVAVLRRTGHKINLALHGRGLRVRVPPQGIDQDLNVQYSVWMEMHRPTDADLRAMARAAAALEYKPVISVLMPAYETERTLLRSAVESVRAQVYPHWELCVVNDASRKPHVRSMLDEFARKDARVRVEHLPRNEGIAGASSRALAMARGEFVALLDHDDELSPDALYEVARILNEDREIDLVYSDEDKIDVDGRRSDPFFKPDWSPDLLMSMNYITHLSVFRRTLVEDAGGFRRGYDGSQDYDLLLRATELTTKIAHVPRVLYHWRKIWSSAAMSSHAKPYAYDAGRRALDDALRRRGEAGSVESLAVAPGLHRVRRALRATPRVSIIIPTRDRRDLLEQALTSIEEKTDYPDYEIIVLDNDSSEPETLRYLETLGGRCQVYRCPGPFNFAAINNLGAARANGEYLVFLNNDIKVSRGEWLRAMLEHAQRPEVGAVGAKLLYPDGRIQHAGLVLGISGPANHAFKGQPGDLLGYRGLTDVVRNCSAVTGACMMVRRARFEEMGGFDPRFKVAYNDVDLCLRLRQRGYLIVSTPFAVLYHYESATRGTLHPPDEEALCWRLWGDVIKRGDPYYNPNLTRAREDWSLNLLR